MVITANEPHCHASGTGTGVHGHCEYHCPGGQASESQQILGHEWTCFSESLAFDLHRGYGPVPRINKNPERDSAGHAALPKQTPQWAGADAAKNLEICWDGSRHANCLFFVCLGCFVLFCFKSTF